MTPSCYALMIPTTARYQTCITYSTGQLKSIKISNANASCIIATLVVLSILLHLPLLLLLYLLLPRFSLRSRALAEWPQPIAVATVVALVILTLHVANPEVLWKVGERNILLVKFPDLLRTLPKLRDWWRWTKVLVSVPRMLLLMNSPQCP